MPLALSESLDDPVTYSASTDFRGGMNSTVLPHLLQDTQYAEAANMVLTKSGRVQTRPGTTLVNAAPSVAAPIKHLGWYDRSLSITAVVAARDNEVKLWDGSAMNATTDDPYTITGAVSAFQLHDNFLFYGAAKAFKLTAASMAEVTVAVGAGAIATPTGSSGRVTLITQRRSTPLTFSTEPPSTPGTTSSWEPRESRSPVSTLGM